MKNRQGFTLIEVALAVLAVGMGLMVIFALFPAGLQNAEDDATDTQAGLFADAVFSSMRGDGAWTNTSMVTVMAGTGSFFVKCDGQTNNPFLFPPGSDPLVSANYLRCRLEVTNYPPSRLYSATLQVCPGQYGLYTTQNVFYTEFVFMGM